MNNNNYNLTNISIGDISELLHGREKINSPFSKELYIGKQSVIGIPLQRGTHALSNDLKPGDKITFLRELDNKDDAKAVMAIDGKGKKLGYIPKQENSIISALLDHGKVFYGIVSEHNIKDGYTCNAQSSKEQLISGKKVPKEILVDLYMREFAIPEDVTKSPQQEDDSPYLATSSDTYNNILDESIDVYPMSERSRIILRLNNVLTLRELSRCSEIEMERFNKMNIECANEMRSMLRESGTSFRPEQEDKMMYGYPQELRNLAIEKPAYWEYYLLMGAISVQYNWLKKVRYQQGIMWWNTEEYEIASDITQILKYISAKTNEIVEFLDTINNTFNTSRLYEAVGEPGEPGNVEKIMTLAEDCAAMFKKIMIWKHRFQYINVPFHFQEIVETLASVGDDLLYSFDDLYAQCNECIQSLDDFIAGRIDVDTLDVTVRLNINCDIDKVKRAIANSFNRI